MENKKGSNLKKLRKQFGLNQTQIAKKIGVSQNSYSRYELGNAEPSYDCLVSLSKIFNVSIDYLFQFTNIKNYDNSNSINLEISTIPTKTPTPNIPTITKFSPKFLNFVRALITPITG